MGRSKRFFEFVERGEETCFGFLQFPSVVETSNGTVATDANGWRFCDFVQSPDPRYRDVVRQFAGVGFLKDETDEFYSERR